MELVLKNLFITEIFNLFVMFRTFHYIRTVFLLYDWFIHTSREKGLEKREFDNIQFFGRMHYKIGG